MAKFSLCDSLSYSLALVLPKYSEHFIQAKLGDDMKQAMCEYRTHSHVFFYYNQLPSFLLLACTLPLLVLYDLFLAGTTTTPSHVQLRSDPCSAFLL